MKKRGLSSSGKYTAALPVDVKATLMGPGPTLTSSSSPKATGLLSKGWRFQLLFAEGEVENQD
jgi:hypothetical protein